MRYLIGAACIAVIAAVGYYFWGEWQAHQAAVARDADIKRAESALYEALKLEPGDIAGARSWCRSIRDDRDIIRDEDFRNSILETCRALRHI